MKLNRLGKGSVGAYVQYLAEFFLLWFRRTVHPILQCTLARVCKLAWLTPGGLNTPEVGLGRTRADHQECELTDGNDSPDFTAEAESRLRRAAEFDCMA